MQGRPFKVVFADDEEAVREVIAETLRGFGFLVYECRDGGEAVRACESIRPDAVLLDLNMPGIDGFEVARRIRESCRIEGVRIVALTGRSTSDARRAAAFAGFDEFLAKPVTGKTLAQALLPGHLTP